MKRVRIFSCIVCVCVALAFAVSAAAVSAGARTETPEKTAAGTNGGQTAVSAASTDMQETYLLRLEGSRVVLYLQGQEDRPLLETDISAANLREADRALLEQGIRVSSYDEILQLLEDFNS